MTPKEKAEELVKKFRGIVSGLAYVDRETQYKYVESIGIERAKQCALICVDEIINSNPTHYWEEIRPDIGYVQNREDSEYYWQEVKNEISNL